MPGRQHGENAKRKRQGFAGCDKNDALGHGAAETCRVASQDMLLLGL